MQPALGVQNKQAKHSVLIAVHNLTEKQSLRTKGMSVMHGWLSRLVLVMDS